MTQGYEFRIDGAYAPATLPMERLALYMAALAKLLGETASVHFQEVRPGSAVLAARVDEPARPKVWERVRAVRDGTAPSDARGAYGELDTLLRKDNAVGALTGDDAGLVVQFPGRTRPEPLVYGPFRQDGTLDGQVIRVGGRDDTVPVHLRDGPIVHTGLYTTPEIARRLAQHYLDGTVRVRGSGQWLRTETGEWRLQSFKIVDFEVLDETPLAEVVGKLRRMPGSQWGDIVDPVTDILNDRHGTAH